VKNGLVLLCLLLLLKPVLPVIEYMANYEYISKVLCVNKAMPLMHCNGKCHLMKELARASENEKPLSSDKKSGSHELEVLFFQEIPTFTISDNFAHRPKVDAVYSNLYNYSDSPSVFHPPAILS
jgi:hypothetical protein